MRSPFRTARVALATLVLATPAFAQSIVAGPFYYNGTNARYYRIAGGNWQQLRAFAQSLGGDLAWIEDSAENLWVRTNVVGSTSKPYIGLNDATTEGTYQWSNGSPSAFRAWRAGEPANSPTIDYVRYDGTPQGTWETRSATGSNDAIVKVTGPLLVPQEFPTIEAACTWLDAPRFGVVLVAPGTYDLQSPLNLDRIILRGSGRFQTTIRGVFGTIDPDVFFDPGSGMEDLNFVARGTRSSLRFYDSGTTYVRRCDIQGLGSDGNPLRVLISATTDARVVLENCRLSNSVTLASLSTNASVQLINSVARDMLFTFSVANQGSTLSFTNCVITRFTGNAPLFLNSLDIRAENTIVADVSSPVGNFQTPPRHCIFPTTVAGPGNLVGDPRFLNPAANDFRLASDSPARDAGSIAAFLGAGASDLVDLDNLSRVVDVPQVPNASPNSPIDIGPYEFQPNACTADLNGDGQVDDIDFVLFAIQYNQFLCP